jgi:hypothetical protein
MPKVIGIVGSRRRDSLEDYKKIIDKVIEIYEKGDTFCSGGCSSGADKFAEEISDALQIPIQIHYAKWHTYGRGAGFMRNTLIAEDSDVLIACVAEDRIGGTEDTIKKFQQLGKTRVYLI